MGRLAEAFDLQAGRLLAKHMPDRVVFEAPVLPKTTQIVTVRKLQGLAYHLEYLCHVRAIAVSETQIQTARSTFGVKWPPRSLQGADRRKYWKREVTRLCRARGWEPANDDEADALCIWFDACEQFGRQRLRLAF